MEENTQEINENACNIDDTKNKKFYTTNWFLWLSLIFFAPLGLFLLWKFHKNYNLFLRIIISVFFVLIMLGTISEDSNKPKVTVIDFQNLSVAEINEWCTNNKLICTIEKEYSNSIKDGDFIRQNIAAKSVVNEGKNIIIYYSMGKEPSLEYKNALKTANTYSSLQHMSKQGIYDQLTSEYGEAFPADAAKYAIEHMTADWNYNALKTAESYSNTQHMSKRSIYSQLTSSYGEKFKASEAQYAIDNIKADWNYNALQTAKSYAENQNMSKQAIYNQLISDYGEKFTTSEAKYAVDNLYKE